MKFEIKESRGDTRRTTYQTASVLIGAHKHDVWVRNIAAGGVQIFLEQELSVGQRVIFYANGKPRGAYVQWADYPLAGLHYEDGSSLAPPSRGDVTAMEKRAMLRMMARGENKSLIKTLSSRFARGS